MHLYSKYSMFIGVLLLFYKFINWLFFMKFILLSACKTNIVNAINTAIKMVNKYFERVNLQVLVADVVEGVDLQHRSQVCQL